jgi:DUF4097 and DUF4098 domain-containing protein YvlB
MKEDNSMAVFQTPGPVRLQVKNPAGEVRVRVHEAPTTEVEVRPLSPASADQAAATQVDCTEVRGEHRVTVEVPPRSHWGFETSHGVGVYVTVPEGTFLAMGTASADVQAEGLFAGGSVETASGDVYLDEAAGELSVATASGDVHVRRAAQALKVRTASGDVEVGRASAGLRVETASGDITVALAEGPATLRAASGDIGVETARGAVEAQSASGDISIGEAHGDCRLSSRSGEVTVASAVQGRLDAESTSGDVTLGIAPGSRVSVEAVSRSGSLSSDIPLGDAPEAGAGNAPVVTVRVTTVSGDVWIKRGRGIQVS